MAVKKITIFSTETCPYCKMEKKWLDEHKIKYENFYVDQNQDKADEMIKKSGQMGVPVTELVMDDGKSELVVGFDRERLQQLLDIKE